MLKQRAVKFGMTPEEFKMLYDKDFKINLKLEKLEKMYIKQ